MTRTEPSTNATRASRTRIEMIDPAEVVEQAAALLRAAWEPPCLCYPADYLRWQFRFPGRPASVAAAAFVNGELAGFLAVMPRRLRHRGTLREVHFMSFGATRPANRGPISVATYATLLHSLRDGGLPIFSFAEPDSVADRLLSKIGKNADYRHRSLGHYPTYAYLPRTGAAVGVTVEEATDLVEFLEVVARCDGPGTLWNAPDLIQLEHYRSDPRGRVLVLVRRPDGEAVGAAMVVLSEAITRQGAERVAMVDQLFLPRCSAEVVKAILDDAGRRWRDRVSSPVVTLPNTYGIDPSLLHSIGLRATPSHFNGHMFATDDDLCFDVHGTTLEIV